jgi:hypothetical protein
VDVLELVHPGKPQGRGKTTCALASGVGIGLPRSGRAVQFQVPRSRGESSALTEFHPTGLTGAVAGIFRRD